MRWIGALGAAAMGFVAHPVLAQAVPQQDQEFAQKAAEGGLMEVQFGQLAQQQAKDEQVVQFGQRMVRTTGRRTRS
jgi:predicted outer membrane protein